MLKASVALLTIAALFFQPSVPSQSGERAPDLAQGIRQVEEGDLEAAVLTLDAVVRALSAAPGREKELAQACVYLGMAHLGLGRSNDAKARLRDAWRADHELKLDPKKFPPRVVRLYQEAAVEARAVEPATAPPPSPRPATPATPRPAPVASPPAAASGGGRSKTPWLIGGGVAAAVAIAVVAASSGSSSSGCSPTDLYCFRLRSSLTVAGELSCGSSDACTTASDRFEVQALRPGLVEAVLRTPEAGSPLFLRVLLPSGQVVEGGRLGSVLAVETREGPVAISVWQPGGGAGRRPYQVVLRLP